MYYDDDDDDPYAPRTGPAAMPSPRSKFAPYYSGCTDSFEDFLEEYEGLAHDCALTDPQRVDVLIRYVAPSLRDFWRSLNGYRSHDWPLFRQSLIDVFGNPTPRHQIMRQKLHSHVQDSSRRRMDCEDDVLQYYRQFLCYSAPLVHAGHLSEEERDAAFLYGFHPEDRKVIQPRLLGKNPFQPPDIPFHFEDVFVCARAAFAYDGSSFWSHVKQFQSPSVRREQPVVEPALQDTYSFRAVTCAIASNAETTTTPDDSSLPSYSTPDSDLPLSSISALESQQTQAPSVTLDQPEPAHTFSTTLLPSASPPSHTPSLVRSATDKDLIPAPTSPIITSTLLPSVFPTPSHASSLAHSAADENPEILTTFPSPSITPAPFSMPMSDFEYLSSATVDQPAPTLSSTSPSSSSISPMFVPSATEDQSEPEFTPTLFASVPTLTSTPSHVHSATGYGTIFASTPPSSSPTSSPCLPAVTEEQPEPETESIPSITPASTFALTPPSSSTFLPSPTQSVIVDQPESEPASTSEFSKFGLSPRALQLPPDQTLAPLLSSSILSSLPPPEISTLDSTLAAPSPDQPSSLGLLSQLSRPCELVSSTPVSAADVVTLSHPELSLSSPGEPVPFLPASPEAPPIAHISPRSTPPQRLPELKAISSVSTQLEVTPSPASPTISPIPQQVTTAQWLLYLDPQLPERQEVSLAYEVSSIKPPALAPRPCLFHSLGSLRHTPARFSFAFVFITTAALVSTLFNASTTLPTFAHKYWSKQEDIGNNRIGSFKTSKSSNTFAQRLRLGQLTPRAPRLVFDPGGPASSSRLPSAHEDVRKRKSKTRDNIISRSTPASPFPSQLTTSSFSTPEASLQVQAFKFQDYFRHTKTFASASRRHVPPSPRSTPAIPIPILVNNLTVFNPGGVAFESEPAHEDSATFDEEDVQ
ncbi:hypothetical protein EDB85DRAFT_2296656 [Lactarius pseudohatsudake]|nr:hypothetical protein EDB85DRAFT_2296656 [Lactarius pseudohatsudake]